MKIGISSYSLQQAIRSGEMDIFGVIDWIADNGGEHVEIVPIGFDLIEDASLAGKIAAKAAERGIDVSNYAIGAQFLQPSDEAYENEIARVMRHVDVAHKLGVTRMRHDVASRPFAEGTDEQFASDLPRLAEACRRIADYAAPFGITTSVENHGYYIQRSDRVRELVKAVDRPNFRTTIDVGNFLCADDSPVEAVRGNLPYASMVHVKDFYVRPAQRDYLGAGWFRSGGGNFLRGAIVGEGDIDMPEVIRAIKESGYDGYISIEFEGVEACRGAVISALANLRKLLAH